MHVDDLDPQHSYWPQYLYNLSYNHVYCVYFFLPTDSWTDHKALQPQVEREEGVCLLRFSPLEKLGLLLLIFIVPCAAEKNKFKHIHKIAHRHSGETSWDETAWNEEATFISM